LTDHATANLTSVLIDFDYFWPNHTRRLRIR